MFKANHVIIDKLEETDTIDSITITQSTIFVSGDVFNVSSKEADVFGSIHPVETNTKSLIYKAGDIFSNDIDQDTIRVTESEDLVLNEPENMDQFNQTAIQNTAFAEEAEKINNLDINLFKSTI